MTETGVVIVTHNSASVVGACLDSCRAAGLREIVVVDNASTDGTCAAVESRPAVRLVRNAVNRGFGAAVNQGATALPAASLLLILNPDARLLTGVGSLVDAANECGAAAGLLVDAKGVPQRGFTIRRLPTAASMAAEVLGLNRVWPGNPVNRRYRCLDADLRREQDVEQPAGAFLLVRKDVWRALGGFDEQFHPVWFEDVDFCRRLVDAGYRIRLVPAVTAAHLGAHSVGRLPARNRAVYWYASLLRYAAKHFNRVNARLVALAVCVGVFPRMLTGIPREGFLASVVGGAEVVRLASRFLVRGGSAFDTYAVVWEPAPQLAKQSSSPGS